MNNRLMNAVVNTENKFFNNSNKEALIVEIRKYPCIYNPQTYGYSNKAFRRSAWRKIAIACGVEGQEDLCKTTWKRLKEKYKRQKDKWLLSQSGGEEMVMWNLYETMNFIEPYLYPRTPSSNPPPHGDDKPSLLKTVAKNDIPNVSFDKPDCSTTRDGLSDFFLNFDAWQTKQELNNTNSENSEALKRLQAKDAHVCIDDSSTSEQDSSLSSNSKTQAKRQLESDEDRTNQLIEVLKSTRERSRDHDEDSTDFFFKSVAMEAKSLSKPKRMKFQNTVMTILCDVLEEESGGTSADLEVD